MEQNKTIEPQQPSFRQSLLDLIDMVRIIRGAASVTLSNETNQLVDKAISNAKLWLPKFDIDERCQMLGPEFVNTKQGPININRLKSSKVTIIGMTPPRYIIKDGLGKITGASYGVSESRLQKLNDTVVISKQQLASLLGVPADKLVIEEDTIYEKRV